MVVVLKPNSQKIEGLKKKRKKEKKEHYGSVYMRKEETGDNVICGENRQTYFRVNIF